MRIFRLWRASVRDLRVLWFALRHPDRPLWLLPATAFLIFYVVDPLNVVAPALGVLDDFVLLPMLLHGLLKLLPLNIRGDFSANRAPDAVRPGR